MLKTILSRLREKISFKNIKDFKFKKYTKLFSILPVLIIVGLALPQGVAHADVWSFVMDRTLFPILYAVFAILLWVGFLITAIGAYTLDATMNPAIMNQVFSNPAIEQGWSLIRDICNLLFLLLLLLVAFGTIVQSQKYNIKNSLLKLLLAVFLINFSNVIAGAIIDFGNILMYGILGFMCATPDSCFTDRMGSLMKVAWNFADTYSLLKLASWDGINSTQVIGAAIAMIYLFLYGFILLAMAAFLLVRTAGLAILLILAPFAYFGEVMPGMEKIASKWWSNIWSYTLFGPIFALMLYISGEIAQMTMAVPPITDPSLGAYSGTIVIIISNLLPLLFLLAIIPVTKELGLAGTDTIMKNTTGLGSSILTGAAKYAGNAADRYAARGAKPGMGKVRRALSNLSPGAWRRAGRSMKAEQEHDFDVAAGSHWNKLEKLPGGNKNVDRMQIAIDREVTRVMATLSDNIAALAATNKKATEDKDAILIEASLKKLSTTGDTSVALRANGKEESRFGLSDYMKDVRKIIGKERAEVLAEDVGYNEDKDGNSGFMGFRKVYDNGSSRLRDLRDDKTYWDDDGNKFNFKDGRGAEIAPDQFENYKETEEFKKKWKTDAQWQQRSVNEKLASKTPYERNKRLKAIALLRQKDELNAQGEKTGNKINVLDDQGAEYYNTIGAKNLDQVENGIKKEMVKQRDALYQYAIKHKKNKWNQEESGLTNMEKAHLLKLEEAVGEDKNRPTNVDRVYPTDLTDTKKPKETDEQRRKREGREIEEGVYDFFATSGTGKGKIGVNGKGEVEMDEIARKNINELADLDEETKKEAFEGYRQVMLHEDEHLKPEVKNLKNPKAREIMAEAGKLAGDNYADMIDYIDKQAAAHVLADVAERGIKGMKDVKYGLGDSDFKPSDSHFVGVKPEVREEVINEMEKVRQNWVNKYEEKMKKDAEKGGGSGGGGTGGGAGGGAHWSEKEAEPLKAEKKAADSLQERIQIYRKRADSLRDDVKLYKDNLQRSVGDPNAQLSNIKMAYKDFKDWIKMGSNDLENDSYVQSIEKDIVNDLEEAKKQIEDMKKKQ